MRSRRRRDAAGLVRSLPILAALVACGGRVDPDAGAPEDAEAPGAADGFVGAPPDASFDARAAADATPGDASLDAIGEATDASSDVPSGSPTDASSSDEPFDAPADAAPEADAACVNPCLVGDGKCEAEGLSTCGVGPGGCNVWGPAVSCGANALCDQRAYRASCSCEPGTVIADGGCVAVIGAPRPVAPLSTATVTSRSPTLHWALAPMTDGAQVDVCKDRACTTIAATFTATGTGGSPSSPLAAGVYFWRMRGTFGGDVGTATSPVWEFFVGAGSAAVDTSWGTIPDVDGDGFADVIVGYVDSSSYADIDVYAGGAAGLSTTPATVLGPTTGYGNFGMENVTIASAGDVDGDGFSDVVLGGYSFNETTDVGTVFVYPGGPAGLGGTGTNIMSQGVPGYAGQRGSISVTAAGDVNGDGYADVLTTGAYDTQDVYVFLGSAAGLSTSPITLESPGPTNFGSAIASAGDVNGDGYGDILVGASAYTGTPATYLYLGGPDGPASPPIALPEVGAIACAGDVNGDGFADVVVGPSGSVYLGDPSGVSTSPLTLAIPASAANTLFGVSVAPAGDIDGDGFADIVVGAEGYYAAGGYAYVYRGSASGPAGAPIELTGTTAFGAEVAGAGDVDGDGLSDVLVGLPVQNSTAAQDGLYVYQGSSAGLAATPVLITGFRGYWFALLDARSRRRRT